MSELVVTSRVERVVVVVMDGLRPDAVTKFALPNVLRLARNGACTFGGTTVRPSVTAAAMASLLTGADPSHHGLQSDRFHLPRSRGRLHPLAHELRTRGLPSSAFTGHIPWLMRPVAAKLARVLGFDSWRFRGHTAIEVLATARLTLRQQRRGLIVLHWADADRAGHEAGWMTPSYENATRVVDTALGLLMRVVDLTDPRTLLVVLADHGGGGRARRRHDSDHPADRTIPIIFGGGGVRPGALSPSTRLVDVPATILGVMDIPVPESYAGRPLGRAPTRVPAANLDASATPSGAAA